jgi:hypothetical protein
MIKFTVYFFTVTMLLMPLFSGFIQTSKHFHSHENNFTQDGRLGNKTAAFSLASSFRSFARSLAQTLRILLATVARIRGKRGGRNYVIKLKSHFNQNEYEIYQTVLHIQNKEGEAYSLL